MTARAANTLTTKSHFNVHSFSTLRYSSHVLGLRTHISYSRLSLPYRFPDSLPCTRRNLSLSTLFTRAEPAQTPSPAVVANVARIEADANAAPHDVPKQLALFEALIATEAKAGYDLIVTRWERMCEFVGFLFLLRLQHLYLPVLYRTQARHFCARTQRSSST